MNDFIIDRLRYWLDGYYSQRDSDAIMQWLTDKNAPEEDIWPLLHAIEDEDDEYVENYLKVG